MAKTTKPVKPVKPVKQKGLAFVECAACRNDRHYHCIKSLGGRCDCALCEKIRAEVILNECTPIADRDKEADDPNDFHWLRSLIRP